MRGLLAAMLVVSTLPLCAEEAHAVPQAVAALEHLKPKRNDGPFAWTAGPYHYDGAGNIDRIGPESFAYDRAGRLNIATVRGPDLNTLQTQSFTCDVYGNLIRTEKLGQIVDLAVTGTTNRLDAATYDASGNMTGWAAYQYDDDAVGMMNSIHVGASLQPRIIYAYTADDQRLFAFDTTTNTTHWTLRGFDNKLLRDFRQSGSTWSVERDYVYRDGRLLAAMKPNNAVEHYTLDHLGSPRLITDAAGRKIGYHVYWPFGEEWTQGSAQEASPLKFTGHERDVDPAGGASPLDYMHARYYRAEWGRFLAVDTATDDRRAVYEPQTWNRYAYVLNNPLRLIDPDGRQATDGLVMAPMSYMADPRFMTADQNGQGALLGATGGAVGVLACFSPAIARSAVPYAVSFGLALAPHLPEIAEFAGPPGVNMTPNLGMWREEVVAKGVGGVVSNRKLVVAGIGSTDIDVIGKAGEFIAVGGAAKALNIAKFGQKLDILKRGASAAGVGAKVYLAEGTPPEVINLAVKKLGAANVVVFRIKQ